MGVGNALHRLRFADMSIFPSFLPPCNASESLAGRWESSRKLKKVQQIRVCTNEGLIVAAKEMFIFIVWFFLPVIMFQRL
jgi:hypothetical protein